MLCSFRRGCASSSEPPNEASFSSEKSHALAVETTRETLVQFRNSRTGVFSMEDLLVDHQEDTSCPLAGLDNEEVLKSFKSFKKFDILSDHTGHRFSTFNPLMNQANVCLCVYCNYYIVIMVDNNKVIHLVCLNSQKVGLTGSRKSGQSLRKTCLVCMFNLRMVI